MGRVILDISMSLDGCVAGSDVGPDNPMGIGGERLHGWMFGRGADTDRAIAAQMFDTAGAIVMGRRMFDLGKPHWGPGTFRGMPVFVLTHRPREPVADEGGSTYTFVSDGLQALVHAHRAASQQDILVAGGADVARRFMATGLIDELRIHLVHVLLGAGLRLFDGEIPATTLRRVRLQSGEGVTHIRFLVSTGAGGSDGLPFDGSARLGLRR